ncbi:MAG: FkbM family methyltransferase [Candidatus Rokubacteria bacterium]|nr:FkbM family methyltransferase [Candidatus Rokubacteria bacterium]
MRAVIERAANLMRRLTPDALSLRPVWLTTDTGVKVGIDSRLTLDMFCELFVTQPYAPALDLAERLDFVVDLGANRGLFVLFAEHYVRGRRPGTTPQFLCIEPAAENLRRLRRNIDANGLDARVSVVQGVVSLQRSGVAEFYYAPHAHGMGAVVARRRVTTRRVPVVDLAAHVKCRRIDLLKIDVEGAEEGVIAAYRCVLERTNVLVGEFHLRSIDYPRCQSLLEAAGLQYRQRTFHFKDVLVVDVYARRDAVR